MHEKRMFGYWFLEPAHNDEHNCAETDQRNQGTVAGRLRGSRDFNGGCRYERPLDDDRDRAIRCLFKASPGQGLADCIDRVGAGIKFIVRCSPLPGPGAITIDIEGLER